MARILAIDYGTKRTGLAVTDPEQIIATGLATVATHELFAFLKNYFKQERVECLVVGVPKKMDNTPSQSAAAVEMFIKKIEKEFPAIPVKRMDERFTSKMAQRVMIDSGLKKKDRRNRETVDLISATIILQDYLEKKY